MKRFYKQAQAVDLSDGYGIELDGKPLKTPGKAPLVLPNRKLAQAVATEWQQQEDRVVPHTMPIMSYVSTAIDRVMPQHQAVAAEITAFAGSDLLCYRADYPQDLAEEQASKWQPLLDWAAARFDVLFCTTSGVMPVSQNNATLMILGRHVVSYDSFRLAGLHTLTTVYGSLVLALAAVEGEMSMVDAFTLSRIDEDHQARLWGMDEEALNRRERLLWEVTATETYFTLLT
ncbi:MAG: ATP12 family protein [Alphaproteobacteria bacterium]